MTAIEHKELKGITIRNIIVTLFGTVSIVASVMTTFYQLKNDIHDLRNQQETQARINEIRLKVLEGNVAMLTQQVDEITNKNHLNNNSK